jgi:hypothetical protein
MAVRRVERRRDVSQPHGVRRRAWVIMKTVCVAQTNRFVAFATACGTGSYGHTPRTLYSREGQLKVTRGPIFRKLKSNRPERRKPK